MLSVRSSEDEKVRLLELGADDYVVKPFGMAELLARARAALRRHRAAPMASPSSVGPLLIDLATRSVSLNGIRLQLSPKEYRLLQVLAQHAGNVVTHQHLLKEVWGVKHVHDAHYLRIFVRKLRRKIEQDATRPRILVTELGVGYRLAQDEPVADRTAGVFTRNLCRAACLIHDLSMASPIRSPRAKPQKSRCCHWRSAVRSAAQVQRRR